VCTCVYGSRAYLRVRYSSGQVGGSRVRFGPRGGSVVRRFPERSPAPPVGCRLSRCSLGQGHSCQRCEKCVSVRSAVRGGWPRGKIPCSGAPCPPPFVAVRVDGLGDSSRGCSAWLFRSTGWERPVVVTSGRLCVLQSGRQVRGVVTLLWQSALYYMR
jgi:hypothetical protein